MRKASLVGFVILFFVSTYGCSTVIRGTQDTITVNSLEKGTKIYIDGNPRGMDQAMAQVKRGDIHTIKVEKDGCDTVSIQTGEKFDWTSLLGCLLDCGIISIPTDLITGAAWKTEPTMYTVSPLCKTSE